MIDFDDGEQLVNIFGMILVSLVVLSLALLVFSTVSTQQEPEAPDAEWSLTQINDSYIRIEHAGGEPVSARNVTVTVNGRPVHPEWTAEVLTENDSAIVRVSQDNRVRLLWQRSESDSDVLKRWNLSE